MAELAPILIVDDESHQRTILSEYLSQSGISALTAHDAKNALDIIGSEQGSSLQVVLTDLKLPDLSGIELIKQARMSRTDLDFIVITAHGSVESAIQAMKNGASDYLLKPVELDELSLRLNRLFEHRQLQNRAHFLEQDNRTLRGVARPIGEAKSMKLLIAEFERVAQTDATILISGETGVGKEVFSRYVHDISNRKDGPFVAINCSAIPENLLESEFFGHEKGAFTGADRRAIGLFERANGGTLFLDELGEMDLKLQPKILRAIEERKIRRVGGSTDLPINVRLIGATHRDLKKQVSEGRFREDLFYRLNVVHVTIPPLRERSEDIPHLVHFFVKKFSPALNVKIQSVDPSYLQEIMNYLFPGNVRELGNLVERSLIYATDNTLTAQSLPVEIRANQSPLTHENDPSRPELRSLNEQIIAFEKNIIQNALTHFTGDVDQAALALQVGRSTFYSKMAKHGLK